MVQRAPLADLLKLSGFVSAQGLKITPEESFVPGRYIALYHMETDDPEGCLQKLFSLMGTPALAVPETVAQTKISTVLCPLVGEA